MHVLFITPNFPPEVNAGATRTYEHCRRWRDAGHDVTVVAPAPNWPRGELYPGYRNKWRHEEDMQGIRVVRVWTWIHANEGVLGRTASFVSFMLRAALCASLMRRVDVVVATSPHFFSGLAGMLTTWLRRRPFILEIRDIWPESVVAVGAMRRSLLIRFLEFLEQRMYQSASHIVTVGSGYREKLLERHVPAEKITVVPNGVDLTSWPLLEADEELIARWRATGKFVCGYVGTVGMAHGLEVILDAADRLQQQCREDVAFWIVGDGATRRHLEQDAERRQLANVVFTGQVSKQAVASVISSCDACLVHLRGTELFRSVVPSKIFETMALNTPIIMGVDGPAREIVLEADAGVPMTPEDPASLVQCVDELTRDRTRYRSGRQYVSQFYNRDRFAESMLAVLTEYGIRSRDSDLVEPAATEPATSKAA